jgi:archaellum biogenesis protein FlaJ (TadC family)
MKEASAPKPAAHPKGKIRYLIEGLGDSIIPKKHRKGIIKYLERASITDVPYFQYGIATLVIFLLAIIADILFLTTKTFSNAHIILLIIISFVIIPLIFIILALFLIFFYKLYLEAKVYLKIRNMEEVFPEFLSELGLNLKSGQNLDEALQNSTEKEFGYLSEEIQRICKKIRLGVEVEAAIREFTNSFDSEIIEETFDLILTSWKKGSSTSQLVDRVYDNMQVMRYLKRKVIASVTSYRIFLSVVTIIIAPAMFALSYHLISLIKSITGQISEVSSSVVFPIAINAVRVNETHFIWFSAIALVLMSACTAMIISIIKTGTIKEGYKQVALFAAGSIIAYRIFMYAFQYFFSMFNV